MTAELLALRIVHILAATFWVGTGIFSTFFLAPAFGAAGPAAGPVMAALQKRGLFTALPVAAVLTILSGARLLMLAASGSGGAYFATGPGRVYSMSGGLAIAAFVFAMLVSRPAGARAARIGGELAAATDDAARSRLGAEFERARGRAATTALVATVLIVLATVGMAVARYVR